VIRRFDTTEALAWETTPTGGVRARARLTRVGVFKYRLHDGTERLEYRPPEEVLEPKSVASLRGAAVTDLHPPDFVEPENWALFAKGHVADDVAADGSSVIGSLLVQESGMLGKVKQGDAVEASCGYTALWDPTPGVTPAGERYDGVQRKIVYNHVGLGPPGWGRQGPTVSLLRNTDGACISETRHETDAQGKKMAKHIVDGIAYEAGSEAHVQAVDKALGRLKTEHETATAELTTARATLATEKQRADTAELASTPAAIAKRIGERANLLARARTTLGAEYLKDEEAAIATDDDTIIRDILKKVAPAVDTGSMDHMQLMTALQVVFAMAVGGPAKPEDKPADAPPAGNGGPPAPAGDSAGEVRGAPKPGPRTDEKPMTQEEATRLERERQANLWRPKAQN
jgi:hypothetical protein